MSRTTFASLALAAGTVFLASSATQAQLVHRYSFNDGTGNDSVGTANGTLLANGSFSGNQLVTTSATPGQQTGVSLPAGAVAGLNGSFSIQQFYTSAAAQNDFAVGSSFSTGTDNFVIFQPRRGADANGANPSSFAVVQPGLTQVNVLGPNTGGAAISYDVLFSYNATGGTAGTGSGSYYINGVLASSADIAGLNLSTKTNGGINGNGPFGDSGLNGSTDDFRIFSNALSAGQAGALDSLGANATNAQINAVVPEPASLGLLGLGGLGLLARRRRTA